MTGVLTKHAAELLTASDAQIDEAVELANPMALRGALYLLTGDRELQPIPVAKTVLMGYVDVYQVADPADVALIRRKAAAFLKAHRDAGAPQIVIQDRERLLESLNLAAGEMIPAEEAEIWLEVLAVDKHARAASWTTGEPPANAATFPVVVIGAGMAGLNAAYSLKRAGIPFTVLERTDDVGGVWWANRYPGARLDTPSRVYTHTFAAGYTHRSPYTIQADNKAYFDWVADEFGLREHIQFETDVKSVTWDEAAGEWVVTAEHRGEVKTLRARAVISAVGFLVQPLIPDIPGLNTFKGDAFHTARWPDGYDVTGKRVAVIGTGCTGYQMVPELVKSTAHLYVFQRTPNWLFPAPGYLSDFPEKLLWLDRVFPFLAHYERFLLNYAERPQMARRRLQADPDFKDEHAVSAVNKVLRERCLAILKEKFADRPDLLEKMTPVAPPMSARPVLFDPEYSVLDVLKRDDVTLVSEGIRRIVPEGIETNDGRLIELDTIVLATGFRANDYLQPMEVYGRNGLRLHDYWSRDGARAYVGSMVPGFPNFFMIYGPNTNLTVGLRIVDFLEMTTRFAIENIMGLVESGKTSVEVTEDAYWRYNKEIDEREPLMIYADHRARNYYKNAFGRSSANNPIDSRVIWNWLRDPIGRRPDPVGRTVSAELESLYRSIQPRHGADLVVR